jgi:hypothetical protein
MATQDNDQSKVAYYNTSAAARYLSVSKAFLERRRCEGRGPTFFKVGRRVLYQLAALESWVTGHARRSTSEIGRADE